MGQSDYSPVFHPHLLGCPNLILASPHQSHHHIRLSVHTLCSLVPPWLFMPSPHSPLLLFWEALPGSSKQFITLYIIFLRSEARPHSSGDPNTQHTAWHMVDADKHLLNKATGDTQWEWNFPYFSKMGFYTVIIVLSCPCTYLCILVI